MYSRGPPNLLIVPTTALLISKAGSFFVLTVVLCTVEWSKYLIFIHYMLVSFHLFPDSWEPKMCPHIVKCPLWDQNHTYLRIIDLDETGHEWISSPPYAYVSAFWMLIHCFLSVSSKAFLFGFLHQNEKTERMLLRSPIFSHLSLFWLISARVLFPSSYWETIFLLQSFTFSVYSILLWHWLTTCILFHNN